MHNAQMDIKKFEQPPFIMNSGSINGETKLIKFFEESNGKHNHIYAHKEFYIDENGEQRSRIKPEHEILDILKKESYLLRQHMQKHNVEIKLDSNGFIRKFPLTDRWLKGEEYGFLCRHYFAYVHILKMFPIIEKSHPETIYEKPMCKYNSNS